MTPEAMIGLAYIVTSAVLQGTFLLPMDYVRNWRWEHSWLAFSFFGMVAFNWSFAFASLPQPLEIYAAADPMI